MLWKVFVQRYFRILLFKPLRPLHSVTPRAQKNHAWVTKNWHWLSWDSGFHGYNLLFCYRTSLKLRFPNIVVLSKGLDKRNFCRNVFDSNRYICPFASEFPQNPTFVYRNHQGLCLRDDCAREKTILFLIGFHSPQFCHVRGAELQRQPPFHFVP